MNDLHALFNPRSLAVIGASNDGNKVGGRPLAFLRRAGWRGRLYPIHPSLGEVQGLRAYRSLAEVDGSVDQAIIAVPATQVLTTLDQCIARGVRAVQVFSAGFGDGEEGAAAMAALRDQARAAGVRLLGPNSLGLFSTVDGFFGTFATALDGAWPQPGVVGVATQSGAFGSYFFGLAQARGLGFSRFIATGNEADVDLADCAAFLAGDGATRVIVLAMEGCRDGRKLAAALQAARSAGKLVLVMKVGVSQAGAAAAATHTGALAGEDRVLDAVLRQIGVPRIASLHQLVDAAYMASIGPRPADRELLIVSTSGGIGVLTADAAEASGLSLAPVDEQAQADIRLLAPLAAGSNPIDTSAGILGDLGVFAAIAERALRARRYHAVLCFVAHIPRNAAHWAQLRGPLLALRRRYPDTAFCIVGLGDTRFRADMEAHALGVFEDPDSAVRALAACVELPLASLAAAGPEAVSRSAVDTSAVSPAAESPAALTAPREVPAHQAKRAPATEHEAKRMLSEQGIRFVPERVVYDAAEAASAGRELGFPAVLKVLSPDIVHKTEVGGVALGLADEAALRAAVPAMDSRVRRLAPDARRAGFLVARQLQGGVELLLGTRLDAAFGPVVTVGAGGVLAELLQDVSVRPAPFGTALAATMLMETRVGRMLQGYRGAPAADLDDLARQIAALSEFAWARREHIRSIDLNPVLALPDGAFAVDAWIETTDTTDINDIPDITESS
ncbi:MAG: acetate--CoA ligase family protein [Burkholderiaceae bacterium]